MRSRGELVQLLEGCVPGTHAPMANDVLVRFVRPVLRLLLLLLLTVRERLRDCRRGRGVPGERWPPRLRGMRLLRGGHCLFAQGSRLYCGVACLRECSLDSRWETHKAGVCTSQWPVECPSAAGQPYAAVEMPIRSKRCFLLAQLKGLKSVENVPGTLRIHLPPLGAAVAVEAMRLGAVTDRTRLTAVSLIPSDSQYLGKQLMPCCCRCRKCGQKRRRVLIYRNRAVYSSHPGVLSRYHSGKPLAFNMPTTLLLIAAFTA
jgi:hypothetical protein